MVIRLQRILKSYCLIVHMVWLTGKFIKLRDGIITLQNIVSENNYQWIMFWLGKVI